MKILLTALMISLLLILPAHAEKMEPPPYSVTFEWDADTTGKVDGYRIYFGNTSRYAQHIIPAITEKIEVDMCKGTQSCIDTWDDYCSLDGYGGTMASIDYRVCDADYFPYDESIDVGLVPGATIVVGPGVWYFTIASYDNEATYEFYFSSPPESRYGEEQTHTFEVYKPVNDCPGDFDQDGDVDGSDLAIFGADFGRTDCSDDCEGDFDNDNDVDGSDLAAFGADFGRTDCIQ